MKRVEKPWGHELIWAHTDRYVAKVLFIKQGHMLSRQYHEQKDETLYVETGVMNLELGRPPEVEIRRMEVGDVFHVTPGTIHRMHALEDVRVFEVSTPELDDVVRLEDNYGREGTSQA